MIWIVLMKSKYIEIIFFTFKSRFWSNFYISACTCTMFSSERRLTVGYKRHNKTEDSKTLWRGFEHPDPKWRIPTLVCGILFWILLALAPNPPEKVESVGLNSPVARLFSRLNNEAKTSPMKPNIPHVHIYTAWGLCIEGRGGGAVASLPFETPPGLILIWEGTTF